MERCPRHRWRCAEVTFTCPDEALCQLWVSRIRDQLATTSTALSQHVRSAPPWLLQSNRAVLLLLSQQTQTPAGLHQPLQREEEGQTHLWAKGRAAVCTGWHPHARHRFVLPEWLSLPFGCFSFVYGCSFIKQCCCRHSDRVRQSCAGSPTDRGRA